MIWQPSPIDATCARGAIWKTVVVLAATLIAASGCASGIDDRPKTSAPPVVKKVDPVVMDLAEKAIEQGRHRDASKLMERVLLVEPQNPRAKLLMAELQLATGAVQTAVRGFEELADNPALSARALQGKGICLLIDRSDEAAFEALRLAVEADPTLWRAWNALGYYYDSKRDWSDSEESYENALAANPSSAIVYNNRGFSRLLQERVDDAVNDLTKALRLDPTLKTAKRNLRLALAWKGQYKHAMLGVSEKEKSKVLNNVGFVALMKGDYPTAESYLLRALETDAGYNKIARRNLDYLDGLRAIGEAAASPASEPIK